MDANTPAWLQANTAEATTSAAPVVDNGGITSVPPPAPPTPAQLQAAAAAADDEDDPDLPGIILTMRLANMGVAVAIIAVSVRWLLSGIRRKIQENDAREISMRPCSILRIKIPILLTVKYSLYFFEFLNV